uniref:Uncharacterized protein n=1 Tax=Sphaerodactylus townsendi TaxID=933632 RepID=A0ACB8EHV2_9SAUR
METSEVGSSVLQMQDHSCPSIHKHLTVEELFGTSMPKDSPPVPYPNPERTEKLQNDASCRDHNFLLPFSFEQSTVIHQPLGKLDGPSFKSGSCTLLQQECVPPLLIAPPPVSQPEITKASNYTVQLSPVVNSASVVEAPSVPALPSLHTNNNIMQVMQQATKQVSPLGNQLPSDMNHGPPNLTPSQNHFITSLAAANTDTSNVTLPNMNLLKKLRLTPQHDQIQQSLSKTPVAPNFSSAVNQLATPDCFKESLIKQQALTGKMLPPTQTTQQGKEPETFAHPKTLSKANQVSSPQVVPATTTMASSVLLSPSVFQQSSMKPSEMESKVGSSSPLPLGDVQTLPPTVLSRSQLQETLIHLIKILDRDVPVLVFGISHNPRITSRGQTLASYQSGEKLARLLPDITPGEELLPDHILVPFLIDCPNWCHVGKPLLMTMGFLNMVQLGYHVERSSLPSFSLSSSNRLSPTSAAAARASALVLLRGSSGKPLLAMGHQRYSPALFLINQRPAKRRLILNW